MDSKLTFSDIRKKLEEEQKSSNYQSATIQELMQMLTRTETDSDQSNRRAPPIPPKPKIIAQPVNPEPSFRKYYQTEPDVNNGKVVHPINVDINSNNQFYDRKSDFPPGSSMQHNHNIDNISNINSFITTSQTRINNDKPLRHTKNESLFKQNSPVEDNIGDNLRDYSFASKINNDRDTFNHLQDRTRNSKLNLTCDGDNMNNPSGMIKANKSTVEISEIEEKANCSTNYDDLLNKNPTFSRSKQNRLFIENNYAKPFVTDPDDDEEIIDDVEIHDHSGVDLEKILNESDRSEPPRTSTPSFECTTSSNDLTQFGNNPLNSTYSKLNIDSSNSVTSNTRQEITDSLNNSRDTDTCVFDVSAGCEVVDVTGSTNNSTNSSRFMNENTLNRTPIRLDFTDNPTNMYSTPKAFIGKQVPEHSNVDADEKVEKLEKLTISLKHEVSRLTQQVEDLTSQMNAMQLSNNNSSQFNLSNAGYGSTSTLGREGLSPYGNQSMSTLGNHSISTLNMPSISNMKKDYMNSVSGSISNLSQIGATSMINLPSSIDYIQPKHGAKEIQFNSDDQTIRISLFDNQINLRVPDWAIEDYDVERVIDQPNVQMKLNWVHGYRGRDCRYNLYFLPTGECVYFVASIIVLFNPVQNSQRHYLGHTESVKCLAIHPNRLIIASGQSAIQNRRDKRPIVRVWNTVSLATLRVITFNEDFDRSICCMAFSKYDCGSTLAVVDESNEHTISLLDWQREKNWRVAEANSGHEPVIAIDFHPIDKYSLIAIGKSSINFWDIRGMTMSKKAGLFDKFDKPKYVLCLTFNDQGETITGDSNGNIMIWARGSNRPYKIIPNVHPGGVFSILAMNNRTYLSGGKDRRIVEWDENCNPTGKELLLPEHCGGVRHITAARRNDVLIGTLRNCILIGSLDDNLTMIVQGHSSATSALDTHPNRDEYLTGGYDDQLQLYNAINHKVLWTKCLTMPATSAAFSPDQSIIIVGSTSGKWLVINSTTQEILFTKCEGSGTINCIKFSFDGQYFAMGSTDGQIYIYQVTSSGSKFWRVGACTGHTGPIKEVDWSYDNMFIQSQSMNFELLFWNGPNCRQIDDLSLLDNVEWTTQNCTLGFSVIGIWPDDSSLVEYCESLPTKNLIVSSTDSGYFEVYQWPACYNQCIPQRFFGNVDKYDKIKFLRDSQRLVATSSKNCVTTEWTLVKG